MKPLQRRIQQAAKDGRVSQLVVEHAWERTLGPFVPDLPDVEKVLAETRERLDALLKIGDGRKRTR